MELTASGNLENKYDYPHTNLLTSSVITIYDKYNNMRRDTISNLTYDDFGRVMHNSRGGTVADMTYSHDKMHGWLTGIRSGGSFEQNLYRETEGCSPCYNGNISAMTWRTGSDYVRRFDYGYDSMNRLLRADFSFYHIGNPSSPSPTLSLIPYVGMAYEDFTSVYSYDKNGNLTGAYRQGLVDDLESGEGYCYDTMDDYNVTYAGNRKTAVNGTGCGTPAYYGSSSFVDGVEDGTDEYAYNTNGAMTKDLNKGITNISYDLLGNLQQITMTGNRSISYVYAADGTRLRTVHSRKVGNVYLKDSTDYQGSLVLKNALPDKYLFDGGYLSFSNSLLSGCHYYIQDYQGSNRMVVNADGTVEQVTHYYPYGGVIGGIDRNASLQAYKFEGKELDRTYGLDWYDIHARQYDPVVPSWHTMDPLCEKYYNISPYAYCAGNPVNTDGKRILFLGGSTKEFKNNFSLAVRYLNKYNCGYVLYELEKSQNIFYIGETKGDANSFDSKNRIIRWNPYKGLRTFGNDYNMFFLSPTTRLNHEAGHALSFEKDPEAYKLNSNKLISSSDETYTVEEAKTINGIERKTAIAFGEIGENEITREDHTGYPFTTDSPISNIPLEQIDEVEINSSQSSQRK